ncbi:MAG TPA: alpha/beta fold hydrolase, partial [Solirubrobacteraceae bacterium]|nr:alpha/beta fold hydrolase [Solirubrobacteraceae bacterium]
AFFATGISELLTSKNSAGNPALPRLVGVGWIAAGVAVVVWAGSTIHALAIVTGISMVLGGLTKTAGAARGGVDDRVIAALAGAASVIFGVLALSWPDITVLILGLLVGPSTVIFGLGQVLAAARVRAGRQPTENRRSRPRWLRASGAIAAVVLALALLAVSAVIHRSVSSPDAFYNPPSTIPARPGVLLRSERYTRGIPKEWRAWRILYTTTREENVPAVASGLVIASDDLPPGPRPVIAWAHGTTGVARQCAPSLLPSRWNADIIPGVNQALARGWVIVATDYVGLGTASPHPYLIGQGEARSVLDSVRAAWQMPQLSLQHKTVLWGHSQGGHAVLWAGALAPAYAPDVHVLGVAALAPASDLHALVEKVRNTLEGRVLGAYILSAYSDIYPDVSFSHYVRPAARLIVREAAGRCLDIPEAVPSVATAVLSRQPIYAVAPLAGALGRRLAQNTPTGSIKVPLLITQGLNDHLVLPSMQRSYVNRLCHSGQSVEYRVYRGRDHLSLLWPGSRMVSYLLSWTGARFAQRPLRSECSVAQR